MYGWRARIGLLIPSSDPVAEIEFARMAPEGVSVYTARVWLEEPQDESGKAQKLIEMSQRAPERARELADVRPSIIIWACTSASFAGGPGRDLEIAQSIEQASGVPTITTSTAVTLALRALGVRRIAMATPYIEDLTQRAKTFFEATVPGLQVLRTHSLGILKALPKGDLYANVAYEAARRVDVPEAEAIFISCTGWRTMEIIEPLERDLRKPVVTSNQASLWTALGRLGIAGPRGYGQLFDRSLPEAQAAGLPV